MTELTQKQSDWLDKLGAAKATILRDAAIREARTNALESLKLVMTPEALGEMRETLGSIRVETKGEGLMGAIKARLGMVEQISILDPGGNPMKEIDTWAPEDLKAIHGLTDEDIGKIGAVMGKLMHYSAVLREMKTEDGEPIFRDDVDLANEFWQPLVREGVIPENFVPDRYSEVTRTLAGANELYDERLQEYSKSLSTPEKFLQHLDLPVAIVTGGLKMASAGMKMEAGIRAFGAHVEDVKDFKVGKELITKADIVEGVAACIGSLKKAADEALVAKDFGKASDSFIAGLKAVLTPVLGKETTTLVVGICTAAAKTAPIGKAIKEKKVGDAFREIGAAVAGALDAASGRAEVCGDIATGVKEGFKLMGSAADTVQKAKAGETGAAFEAAMTGITGAVAAAAKEINGKVQERAVEKAGTDEQKKKAIEAHFEAIDNAIEKGGEGLEKLEELPGELKELAKDAEEKTDKSVVAELEARERAAQEKELAALLTEPDPQFDAMLAYGFSEAQTDEEGNAITEEMKLASIERLMAEVARNDKIYTLATTLATGGAGVVAKFIPGVGLAKVGLEMIFAMGEAYQKGKQLAMWMENVKDAGTAATAQLHAIRNRYKLQNQQTIEARAQAALKAIEVIGEAMKLAAHFAPVGYAVAAAAAGAEAALETAKKIYDANEMRSAWKIYQDAIANPKNRKRAREAMETNPTLAKYALAWGALNDGNAIAQEALRRCGLNDRTLANPGTNVNKVVQYLELIYKDDPKLLRAVPVRKDWYPGSIELSVKGWNAFYKAAQEKAKPKLVASGDVSGIIGGLFAASKDREAFLAAATDEERLQRGRKAQATAEKLVSALARFTAKSEKGGEHEEMAGYVAALREQAIEQREEYAAAVAELERQPSESID